MTSLATATVLEAYDAIIPQIRGTLALSGFNVAPSHRILDFGCGSGRAVKAFRQAGYAAYGVDLKDFIPPCSSDERTWFSLSRNSYIYELPYPDKSFDVIFSISVLEHVVYLEPALEEMRRVLKPDGIAIHIFPSKWRLREGHFKCPLGGFVTWWYWLKLWGCLGFANPSLPKSLSLAERAEINWKASRTNYTYHTLRELRFFFGLHFGDVRFAEKAFIHATVTTSGFSSLAVKISKVWPPVFWMYRHFHTKVAVLSGYSHPERFREGWILY